MDKCALYAYKFFRQAGLLLPTAIFASLVFQHEYLLLSKCRLRISNETSRYVSSKNTNFDNRIFGSQKFGTYMTHTRKLRKLRGFLVSKETRKNKSVPNLPLKVNLNLTGAALIECQKYLGKNAYVDLRQAPSLKPMPLMEAKKEKVYFQHISKAGGSTIGVNLPGWLSEHGPVNFDMVELRRKYVGGFNAANWLRKTCMSRCASNAGVPVKVVSAEKSFARTKSFIDKGWFGLTSLRDPLNRAMSAHNHFVNKDPKYAQMCGTSAADFLYNCCRKGLKPCVGCRKCERISNWQATMMLTCDRYSTHDTSLCSMGSIARIEEAKANIESFGMVMILEHMGLSQCIFFWKLNLRSQFSRHCIHSGFRKSQRQRGDNVNSHKARFQQKGRDTYAESLHYAVEESKLQVLKEQNSVDQIIYDYAMVMFARDTLGMIRAVTEEMGLESTFELLC